MPNMKPLMQLLKETLTLNSRDYEFIKNKIEKRNTIQDDLSKANNFSIMMNFLFSWSETPQGHAYWHGVIQREMKMQEDLSNHSHE